jgi:hypothetical protein
MADQDLRPERPAELGGVPQRDDGMLAEVRGGQYSLKTDHGVCNLAQVAGTTVERKTRHDRSAVPEPRRPTNPMTVPACGETASITAARSESPPSDSGEQGFRFAQTALFNGWPALDQREAPVCGSDTIFRGFAQSGSNPGHPFFPC